MKRGEIFTSVVLCIVLILAYAKSCNRENLVEKCIAEIENEFTHFYVHMDYTRGNVVAEIIEKESGCYMYVKYYVKEDVFEFQQRHACKNRKHDLAQEGLEMGCVMDIIHDTFWKGQGWMSYRS